MRHLKPSKLHEAESASCNELIDRAIQIAAACNQSLQGIESILPGGDVNVVATAMLQK